MIEKIFKNFCIVSIVFIATIGIFIGRSVQAAMIDVVAKNLSPEIGQPFRVDIPLDTQGDNINAIQAQIFFPAGQFVLSGINDGASPVAFWISPPAETASGTLFFSGIMPDGFVGAASSVVSFWFLPTQSGNGIISFGDVQVLEDDGNGTPIPTATDTLQIAVSTAVASSTPVRPVSFAAPESFLPVVSRDPNIFSGQYFLAFSTTDKGSGIDYYQVLEAPTDGTASSWQTATSPYLLEDQSLESNIYVRAVDHAGNYIVVEIPAMHSAGERARRVRDDVLIILLCIVLILLILFSRALLGTRRKKV
jgi:hypothetical protein